MEEMVAVETQDKCFPVSGCHQPLPWCFSTSDIFHFPNVMDLKLACGRLAIFTFTRIQPSDKFRSTQCKRQDIGRYVHLGIVGCHWFEVFWSEYSDYPCLFLVLHGKRQSFLSFELLDDFIHACFVLVCQGFEQASLPNVV